MTFEQMKFAIEQIRKFTKQKKDTCYEAMDSLLDKTRFYFAEINFYNLFLKTYNKSKEDITKEDFISDCNTMIFTLEGMLSKDKNYYTVKSVLNDIEKFRKSKSNKSIREAIKIIYHTYSDRIRFNKVVEKTVTELDNPLNFCDNADKSMLDGMLAQIENYAADLCNGKTTKSPPSKTEKVVVNLSNTNNNSVSSNINVNISVEIENTIKQVEDACLPDEQEKEVLAKLQELKEIVESKDSKKSKWVKIKDFFKWVAEQGIQVASIIVPLLSSTLK